MSGKELYGRKQQQLDGSSLRKGRREKPLDGSRTRPDPGS